MMRMQLLASHRLAAGALGLALTVAAPMAGGSVSAASSPSPALVAAEAAPAVQLVVITYSAAVLVPHQKNNLVAQHAGEAGVQAMAAAGEIGSSLQALNDQWAKELASDPGKYNFASKPVHTVRTSTTATCSGWFVTPGGYLVTAAHCVTTDSTIQDDLAGNVLPRYIRRSYRETVARWTRQHVPMDQAIHSELRSYETKWFEENSAVTHTSIKAVVALGVRGKNGQRSQRALPARIVSHGTPYPGQDFALLKVSGRDNLPTLGLGNQSRLVVGDNLYIDGFPGTVTDSTIFTQQSRLAPTFTDGLLSAFRTTNKNVPYLQTQAPAYHGNSGGPVLDADGNVVGTLIAGAADPNTGQLVSGEQFALPAAVIARELAGQGVHPATGTVTADYDAALRDYFNGYYTWALAGFHRVLAAFPDHPYAAQYAHLAQEQIAAGHDRTPKGSFPWLVVVLILVAVAAIGGGLIAWSRGRRRFTGQPTAPGSGAVPGPGGLWPPPAPPQPMVPIGSTGWPPPPPPQPVAPAGGPGWPPPPGQSAVPGAGSWPAPAPADPGSPPPPSAPADAPEADRPGSWPAPE